MADIGIPFVIMGRGAWQKAADPEALETFILKMGTFTLLTWALIISAAFVLFGLSLSFYLLFDHLSGYNKPEVGIDLLSIKMTLNFRVACQYHVHFIHDMLQGQLKKIFFSNIKCKIRGAVCTGAE